MSRKQLIVADKPCSTCPYRRDTPRGIWDESEYRKLPEYDENPPSGVPAFATFLCHHSPSMTQNAACRGWLTVHQNSVAVRLALLKGLVTPEQVNAEPTVELFKSGRQACAAGLEGIKYPSSKTLVAIDKMAKAKVR